MYNLLIRKYYTDLLICPLFTIVLASPCKSSVNVIYTWLTNERFISPKLLNKMLAVMGAYN